MIRIARWLPRPPMSRLGGMAPRKSPFGGAIPNFWKRTATIQIGRNNRFGRTICFGRVLDATAIWFMQVVGREIHLIEASGADLGHYVSKLRERGYSDAGHIVPHDAEAKELGTGKSRLEAMESLGLGNIQVCVKHFVPDGINAGRVMNPKCWFDVKKCESCANGLSSYSDPTLGVRNRVGKLRGPGVAALVLTILGPQIWARD